MKVNICGIMHEVKETVDDFGDNTYCGQIKYGAAEILINKNLPPQLRSVTLCHEILHGILEHLGYEDLTNDERFVSAVSTGLNQAFSVIDHDAAIIIRD